MSFKIIFHYLVLKKLLLSPLRNFSILLLYKFSEMVLNLCLNIKEFIKTLPFLRVGWLFWSRLLLFLHPWCHCDVKHLIVAVDTAQIKRPYRPVALSFFRLQNLTL